VAKKIVDVRLAVMAAVLAVGGAADPVAALLLLAATSVVAGGMLLARWLRGRAAADERAAAQAALHDAVQALVDSDGGLYDQCLAAEAERGLRMLDQWRRTHSP